MVDEVVWSWGSIERLLWALAYSDPPREGDPDEGDVTTLPSGPRREVRAIGEWRRVGDDAYSQLLQRMEFSFVDGNGDPIVFPLRLVSSTKFDEDVLPGDVIADLFGERPDPESGRHT